MQKAELTTNEKIFVIRTKFFVKASVFAKHLADYFFYEGLDFDKNLSKKMAQEILKEGLKYEGLNGAHSEHDKKLSKLYDDAYNWVMSKYDWYSS